MGKFDDTIALKRKHKDFTKIIRAISVWHNAYPWWIVIDQNVIIGWDLLVEERFQKL